MGKALTGSALVKVVPAMAMIYAEVLEAPVTKVWIGGYVSFDAERQSEELLPLLECLRYASEVGYPIDEWLLCGGKQQDR